MKYQIRKETIMNIKCDFSGYATKSNLKCSDGRTILPGAFKHQDGVELPLVWQHFHDAPENILGHVRLENRDGDIYCYGYFNNTAEGLRAKELVEHKDLTSLSIYANKLKEINGQVEHGEIREVSLVLSGANPGATIDYVNIAHGDGTSYPSEDEAIIHSGLTFDDKEPEKTTPPVQHADSEKTVGEVFDEFSEEQKNVVYAMLAQALGEAEHSNIKEGDQDDMKKNIFDQTKEEKDKKKTLSHTDLKTILVNAKKNGSLKDAFLAHIATYGIDDIDYLFPDAKNVETTPDFIKRDTGWVSDVMTGTKHMPFSRIKSTHADITADEARAKGYVKGALKVEEVITLLKRVTSPTTIYKKQKLDRDDILDITDFDVVSWLKSEMRLMLDEEIARAVLVGDGRNIESVDKVDETSIRPIYTDSDVYVHRERLTFAATDEDFIEKIIRAREFYKGSGNPVLYITTSKLSDLLLLKDITGRRLYPTEAELMSVLRVSKIVEVPVMSGLTRTVEIDDDDVNLDLLAILVNLKDYTIGADKGGQLGMFDDFDINYNQYLYLLETRISGALTRPKSAVVFEKLPQGDYSSN